MPTLSLVASPVASRRRIRAGHLQQQVPQRLGATGRRSGHGNPRRRRVPLLAQVPLQIAPRPRVAAGWLQRPPPANGLLQVGRSRRAPTQHTSEARLVGRLARDRVYRGWRLQPLPYAGRAGWHRHPGTGLVSRPVVPRHTLDRTPHTPNAPQQLGRGRALRAAVPLAEWRVQRGRLAGGWRNEAPAPSAGRAWRGRLPWPPLPAAPRPRVTGHQRPGAYPAGGTTRHLVPGSGLTAAPVVPRIEVARAWSAPPHAGKVRRGRVPGSGLSPQPVRLTITPIRRKSRLQNHRPLISEYTQLGGVAGIIPRRIATGGRAGQGPPTAGNAVRQPVPIVGASSAAVVGRHRSETGGSPAAPRPGRTRRGRVPLPGLVSLQVVLRARRALAPRPGVEAFAGRLTRSWRVGLSSSGRAIAGPYYVTAGQVYHAGAVAGDVLVE